MAHLRYADEPCECPLIGADRKWRARGQNDANEPQRTLCRPMCELRLKRFRMRRAIAIRRLSLLHCPREPVVSMMHKPLRRGGENRKRSTARKPNRGARLPVPRRGDYNVATISSRSHWRPTISMGRTRPSRPERASRPARPPPWCTSCLTWSKPTPGIYIIFL